MRKGFTTMIEESVQSDFKTACKKTGFKMNEVLKVLMQEYINGNLKVETSYTLKTKK